LQLKTGPPGTEFPACSSIQIIILIEKSSVADPDPDPDPQDPYVLGLPDPDPLVRDTVPDQDPSVIKQKYQETH
jgi:hypothetical protein